MDCWEILETNYVEEDAILVVFGSLPLILAGTLQVIRPNRLKAIMVSQNEKNMPVIAIPLPMKNGLKAPTAFPRLEGEDILYRRGFQENKAFGEGK